MKQFGFMFGGGRSGFLGLKALQVGGIVDRNGFLELKALQLGGIVGRIGFLGL